MAHYAKKRLYCVFRCVVKMNVFSADLKKPKLSDKIAKMVG